MDQFLPYTVKLCGSNNPENDDCWTTFDFATEEEAKEFYFKPNYDKQFFSDNSVSFYVLEGPTIHLTRPNPNHNPKAAATTAAASRQEWADEALMQSRMGGNLD